MSTLHLYLSSIVGAIAFAACLFGMIAYYKRNHDKKTNNSNFKNNSNYGRSKQQS